MMMILLVLCLILIFLWYLQIRKYHSLRNLPGPPGHNLFWTIFKNIQPEDVLKELLNLNKHYGPLVKVWMKPHKPTLFITDPKYVEYILTSTVHLDKCSLNKFFRPLIGLGLGSCDGDAWKVQRKLMNPGFHNKLLEEYVHVFETCGNRLINTLMKDSHAKSIDIWPIMKTFSLSIIYETLLNTKEMPIDNDTMVARKMFFDIAASRMIALFKQWDFLFKFTKTFRVQQRCVKTFNTMARKIIRNGTKNKHSNGDGDEYSGMKKHLIDILMEERSMSTEELQFQINTIMLAGHLTLSAVLSFGLYELAKHPQVQVKILEETNAILGNEKSAAITFRDVQKMKYVEMVIKEIMRLHTPVPFIDRKVKEDITIDGVTIPKGVEIFISIYNLHRNAVYFPNPENFDPERFSDENIHKIPPYTYISFSMGPRNCIGKTFAMLEMKTLLAKIIRNFEIFPAQPKHVVQLSWEVALASTNGTLVELKRR